MEQNNGLEEIRGTVENVVYRNDTTDYSVLEISDAENRLITAVGMLPATFEGERVLLRGRYTYHKDYGKQFAFESFEKKLPEEEEGILQYLSSGTIKGVGPVTALKIVNRFGKETFDVMENHPEWLADLPGITMKKAAEIHTAFREQTGMRDVMMFCRDHLSVGEVTKVYKRFGSGAVGILQENPYILCEGEDALPFTKADEFAASIGFSPTDRHRIFAGVLFVLQYNAQTNGHTCLPKEKLVGAAAELLSLDGETVQGQLRDDLAAGRLSLYRRGEEELVMQNEAAEAERRVAERLLSLDLGAERMSGRDITALIGKMEQNTGLRYAVLQKRAIFEALDGGVMILTGGPGTGKTTVVKALLSIFDSMGMRTVLAAPTGRAAKRMSEATSEEAKTIHRLLETERTGTNTHFCRNEKHPLDEHVVIVDEASMIDLWLMDALLRAMRRGGRLILIGDADQLPSVGAGNILTDLLASERIRTVRLTEIFRQSETSMIVTNAHRINSGMHPILNAVDNDFFFVRREDESAIPQTVVSLVTERLPKTYGKEILSRIQIITPSKKGVAGVEVLNALLQEKLNPKGRFKCQITAHGVVFREGDRVMQTVNDYDLEWSRNGAAGTGVFNGDIGEIGMILAREEKMTIRFDDRLVEYPFDKLDELDLAYAITVHKSQGSEYPVVILPMYSCPPMLRTRNLLYTAVTRAREMVILVGRADVCFRMVENNRQVMRYTTLCDRLAAEKEQTFV